MSYIIIGLGNPGAEYQDTRHNTGRMMLGVFATTHGFSEWTLDNKIRALTAEGKIGKEKVLLVEPETFMNKSGEALKNLRLTTHNLQKGKKKTKEATNLAVIHDDLDIPFGKFKISFNKSSGGHRGVESIIKAVKTQAFVRVRVGIASSAAAVKKAQDESSVEKTILGKFKPVEIDELKKLSKKISEVLALLVAEGREVAMSRQGSL